MSTTTALPLPSTLPAAFLSATPGVERRPDRLLTAADLAVFPTYLPSGDVKYELDNGRLVVMAPPGDIHSREQGHFLVALATHGEARGYGEYRGEVGIVLRRNPDRVVGADAAFVVRKSLPVKRSPEGYLETIPELVVEVRSKNDTTPEVEAKVQEYLTAGVILVWVADPDAATVTAFRPDAVPQVYRAGDTLNAAPVIPDFAIPVDTLFRP